MVLRSPAQGADRVVVPKDRGQIALAAALAERLVLQHQDHPDWSYQLHYDNLAALVMVEPELGRLPSHATIKRDMQAHGLVKQPPLAARQRPGQARAQERRQTREVRSYEAESVAALGHLEFHHGSLTVLTPDGRWLAPIALGILDDHSRLCCHVQW